MLEVADGGRVVRNEAEARELVGFGRGVEREGRRGGGRNGQAEIAGVVSFADAAPLGKVRGFKDFGWCWASTQFFPRIRKEQGRAGGGDEGRLNC